MSSTFSSLLLLPAAFATNEFAAILFVAVNFEFIAVFGSMPIAVFWAPKTFALTTFILPSVEPEFIPTFDPLLPLLTVAATTLFLPMAALIVDPLLEPLLLNLLAFEIDPLLDPKLPVFFELSKL